MTISQEPAQNTPQPRLVASRKDFLVVYVASLVTAIALLSGAMIVNDPGVPFRDLLLPALVSVLISLVPPAVAMLVPSGRRTVQILFGMALLPVVGAWAINLHSVAEKLLR